MQSCREPWVRTTVARRVSAGEEKYLTRVEKDAERGPVGGLLEVGTREYDDGTLSAQLERDFFQVALGGGLHDLAPRQDAPRERDLVNVHVARDRAAGGGAETGHEVEDAGGVASFGDEVAEVQGRKRGQLGRLHDDGAAAADR